MLNELTRRRMGNGHSAGRWAEPALLLLLAPVLALIPGCASPSVVPPVALRLQHTQTIHGELREDPYHWLRGRDDPKVIAYLEAENQYTDRKTKHTKRLQERLYREMKGRIKETDLSVLKRSRLELNSRLPVAKKV